MENKLEQLLNSLIEKGWCPANRTKRGEIYKCEVRGLPGYVNVRFFLKEKDNGNYGMNIRELVSMDTGLRQFCMSKGFTPNVSCYRWEKWFYDIDDLTQCEADVSGFDNYGYRLIEASLKDESELESFILDNIKVEGPEK